MSQTYNDAVPASTRNALNDLNAIRNNFAALKSAFSGTSAPSDAVAGMWWLDTTNHLLKHRNEANDAWLSIWDMANNKPVIANLSGEITGAMIAAAVKDAAAGTASLRTLGTGATQAAPGNDSRFSEVVGHQIAFQWLATPVSKQGTSDSEIFTVRAYIPYRSVSLYIAGNLSCEYGTETARLRAIIGALTGPYAAKSGPYAWADSATALNVSSVAGSVQTISINLSCSHASGTGYCQGVSLWIASS